MITDFGPEEQERYSRQRAFHGIGKANQEKLAQGRVLILGCGGLGSAAASLLARAGVGYLKLVDRDFLELNNLQRQILYDEHDVKEGLPKAIAAQRCIQQINATVQTDAAVVDVNRFNIARLIGDVHLVIDATDNFETRFLLNEACVQQQRPWIYGAAIESYGLTMTILPGKTACLRCIMDHLPTVGSVPTCESVGILASIVTMIASIQSVEAIKILTGQLTTINRHLLSFDVWDHSYQTIALTKENLPPNCPVCKQHRFDFLEGRSGSAYTTLCGRNAVQILPFQETTVDLARLAIQWSELGIVRANEYLIRFEIGEYELSIFPDGRAIVKGTTDTAIARSLYAKYVGH